MRLGRVAVTSLATLVALLISCSVITKDPNAKLPADWPIAQLTLPLEIELQSGPGSVPPSEPGVVGNWAVGWSKDDNWQAAIDHVEGCLKPLSYWRSKNQGLNNPLGLDLPEMRTYYSPDYLTEVTLSRGAYFDAIGSRDIEFAMMIRVYETPPPLIEAILGHQQDRPEIYQTLHEGMLEEID